MGAKIFMQRISFQRHAWVNQLQTGFLISALLAICALVGSFIFGTLGVWMAIGSGLLALLIEPSASWRVTLNLYRAQPIHPEDAPVLWEILRTLSLRAGLPSMPTLYYLPSPLINAFAVGSQKRSAIALTYGLLNRLNSRELAGVLAHEVAHIANGDLRVMGLADGVSRLTALLSMFGQLFLLVLAPILILSDVEFEINWPVLLVLLLSPHLTLLMQLGLSRLREYDADLNAALLTDDPQGLALALAHIEQASRGWFWILLPGWGNPEPSWLRSHPSTAERIRRLQALVPQNPQPVWASQLYLPEYINKYAIRAPRWRVGGYWR